MRGDKTYKWQNFAKRSHNALSHLYKRTAMQIHIHSQLHVVTLTSYMTHLSKIDSVF